MTDQTRSEEWAESLRLLAEPALHAAVDAAVADPTYQPEPVAWADPFGPDPFGLDWEYTLPDSPKAAID